MRRDDVRGGLRPALVRVVALALVFGLAIGLALGVAGCSGGSGGGGDGDGGDITVPDVVGLTQANASAAIVAATLVVGNVASEFSATVATGNVIRQDPSAGASRSAGQAVDLTISLGPELFGIDTRPPLAALDLPTSGGVLGSFSAVPAFPSLSASSSIVITGIPGDTRLLFARQNGQIRAFDPVAGVSNSRLVLDLSSLLVSGGERGLIGLALDPAFENNRHFFVHYTRTSDGASVIARFTWDAVGDLASLASEKIVLVVDQPASNHNGGSLAFGPDGFLYIAFGDGGGSNDQFDNGQDLGELLGKILRIDVSPADPDDAYDVPVDNPFVGMAGRRPEIWAYGLRNPFRMGFDRQTGELYAGDVGQNEIEEIDRITRGGNFGWPGFEGTNVFRGGNGGLLGGVPHSPPIHEYDHSDGIAVIGGYVYRGSRIASLIGRYLFADYGSGTIWALDLEATPSVATVLASAPNPTSFGEDQDGELYLTTQGSGLYRLDESGGAGSAPALLSETGVFSDLATLTPASGLIEYELNMPFWSDGASKRRWIGLPDAARIGFSATGSWSFPVGTVLVKHFEMEMVEGDPGSARRLETRILTRGSQGWLGFTYRWNPGETDADLLASRESETLVIDLGGGNTRTQQYDYPSRTDCLRCHTDAAGGALGLATRQLNRSFDYGAVTDNQLHTLNHIDYFTNDIGAASQDGADHALGDAGAPVATRARAYLATNCAQCHRPNGGTPVTLDLRFETADTAMDAIDVVPASGDLGLGPAARIIAPGDKENSTLWRRIDSRNATSMPPLATHRIDEEAVGVIGAWIDGL